MRAEIIDKIRGQMPAHGLDAVVLSSPQNFNYVSGFTVPSHPLFPWRLVMAVIPARGEVGLVTVDMEASTVRKHADGCEIRVWREFVEDPIRCLVGLLGDLGLSSGRIGVETDHLNRDAGERLGALIGHENIVPVQNVLALLRQIKTASEISLLRELSLIADQAIAESYDAVSAGSSEMDIAAALTRGVYSRGAEEFKLMIVATGERSQLPNVGPSERRLEAGDICRVEIFPLKKGYHAGVCRTASVGKPSGPAPEIWTKLVECKYQILDALKPGASGREIYSSFTAQLKRLNLPPIAFVGHGIGVHLHEEPYLGIGMDAEIKPGTVLGIEPLCYETGHGFGMQNKDMVLVTETGAELLSSHCNTDELLVIE